MIGKNNKKIPFDKFEVDFFGRILSVSDKEAQQINFNDIYDWTIKANMCCTINSKFSNVIIATSANMIKILSDNYDNKKIIQEGVNCKANEWIELKI